MEQIVNAASERPRILSNVFGGRIGNALSAVAEVVHFCAGARLLRIKNAITYNSAVHSFKEICGQLPAGWQPQFVLFVLNEIYSLPFGIEDSPYTTVCIPGDCLLRLHKQAIDMEFFDVMLPSLAHFEKVFTAMRHPQVSYTSRGAVLGITNSPQHWDPPESERPHDVVFCGSVNRPYYHRRIKYLERLLRLQDRYKIVTAAGNLPEDEYRNLLRRAKIVIEVPGVECGVNLRTFEAVQYGAMLMHDAQNRAVEEFYRDRQEVVLFDETDFEEVLEHYVTHADERIRIARQAQQRSVNTCTMPVLARRVIDRLCTAGFARRENKSVQHLSTEEKCNLLACSDFYAKNYARAVLLLKQSILKNPDNWEYVNNIGVTRFSLAEIKNDRELKRTARRNLHHALKLDPSSWVVRYNLLQLEAGEAVSGQGGLALAALALHLAEELRNFIAEPEPRGAERVKGLLILDDRIPRWQFEMDQWEDIAFAQALEQHPARGLDYAVKIAGVMLTHAAKIHARVLSAAGEYAEAAGALFDGLRASPEHGGLWRLLGEQFLHLEQWREAAEAFENSLAILPLQVDAELGLIRALVNLGETESARERAEDFVRTNLGAPERNGELRAMVESAKKHGVSVLTHTLTRTPTRF